MGPRHQSQEWLRAIFDGARDAMFIVGSDGGFVDANEAATKLTGYTQEQLTSMTIPDLHRPEDLCSYPECLRRVLDGEPRTEIVRILRSDGTTVEAEFSSRLIVVDGKKYLHTIARDVSERKQAERELERSSAIYRSAIENANGVPYWLDIATGRYAFVGQGIESLLGVPTSELCIEKVRERVRDVVLTDEDVARTLEEYGHAFGRDEIACYRADVKIETPQGKIRWLSDCAVPVHDDNGKVTGSLGILQDITWRKQAEEALRRSEERFRIISDTAADSIFIKDRTLRYVHVNPAMEKLLQKPSSQLLGRTDHEIFGKEAGAHIHLIDNRVLAGETMNEEHTKPVGDTSRTFNVTKVPVRNAKGEVVGLCGIARDITDRKKTEEALRESEAKLSSFFKAVPVGVGTMQGRIMGWGNDLMYTILRFPPGSLQGHCSDTAYETHEEFLRVGQIIREGIEQHGIGEVETRLKAGDGAILDCNLRAAPIDSDNPDAGIVITVQDISERKRNERELAKYRNHLEELVERRTAQLRASQERLRLTERLASIGTLAAGVAHEINNPIGMIALAAQNILELKDRDHSDKMIADCVTDIVECTKRCAQITGNVLRFAKEERSSKRAADFNDLIRRAITFTRAYADQHGSTVELELAEDLPHPKVNAVEIEQVFVNLIQNAVDSSRQPVNVVIRTMWNDSEITATVSDDGRGIQPEDLKHIFDPFYTTRRESGGTGLGLSVVHGIVAEHGGTIDVESQTGKGTTFVLRLPLNSAEAKPGHP